MPYVPPRASPAPSPSLSSGPSYQPFSTANTLSRSSSNHSPIAPRIEVARPVSTPPTKTISVDGSGINVIAGTTHRRTLSNKRKAVPSFIEVPSPSASFSSQHAHSPASPSTPNATVNPPPPPPRSLLRGGGLPPPPRHNASFSSAARSPLSGSFNPNVETPEMQIPKPGARSKDQEDGGKVLDVERGQGRPSTFENADGEIPRFGEKTKRIDQSRADSGYFPRMDSQIAAGRPVSVARSFGQTDPLETKHNQRLTSPSMLNSSLTNDATIRSPRKPLYRSLSEKSLPPLPPEAYLDESEAGPSNVSHNTPQIRSPSSAAPTVLQTPSSSHNPKIPSQHPWAIPSYPASLREEKLQSRGNAYPSHNPIEEHEVASEARSIKSGKGLAAKFKSKVRQARFDHQPSPVPERRTSLHGTENVPTEKDVLLGDKVKEEFSVDSLPSQRILWEAGTQFLRDGNGDLVAFSDLFPKYQLPTLQLGASGKDEGKAGNVGNEKTDHDAVPVHPRPRTVLFFIRHFWCGQCQDFMQSSISLLDENAVKASGIRVVIISNGSWKIIKSYKKIFKCPFEIYVDAPRKLYQLMGMTKLTNDFGPWFSGRASYNTQSVPRQLLSGGKNAIKMPLAYPGKFTQLGGEFILAPGYICDFAHRMTNTSNHMEAPDVLRIAGCAYPTKEEVAEFKIAADQREEYEKMQQEMQNWKEQREKELERIRRRRAERRGEQYIPPSVDSPLAIGLDEEFEEEEADVERQPQNFGARASETRSSSMTSRHSRFSGIGSSSLNGTRNGLGQETPPTTLEDIQSDDEGDQAQNEGTEPTLHLENAATPDSEELDLLFIQAMKEQGVPVIFDENDTRIPVVTPPETTVEVK